MAKTIKQEGEATKVAIRLARKTIMEQIKKLPSKDVQRLEEKRVCVPTPSPWPVMTHIVLSLPHVRNS